MMTSTRLHKSTFLASLLALGGLLSTPAQARTFEQIKASGTVRIATEGAFRPFNYYDGTTLKGFEVDLGNALAKQLGVKALWVTQPFDNLLIGLGQDRYDFVIASHGITPERLKAVDFTNPHYCTGGAIITTPTGPKTAAALSGKTVAVQVGTTYLDNMKKVPNVGEVKTFPKDSDAQAALMAGRAQAWVTDRFLGLDAIKAQKGKLVEGALLFQERNGMAVKKGNSTLTAALNKALAAVQKDGSYAKLSNQYFGQDIRCK